MTVEFNMASLSRIIQAAKNLNFNTYVTKNDSIVLIGSMKFNLETGIVDIPEEPYYIKAVNKLKIEYSRLTLKEIAKKKRWILKTKLNSKFELKRM